MKNTVQASDFNLCPICAPSVAKSLSTNLGEIVFADDVLEAVGHAAGVYVGGAIVVRVVIIVVIGCRGDAENPVLAVAAGEEVFGVVVEDVCGGEEYAAVGFAGGQGVDAGVAVVGGGPEGEQ